MMAVILAASTMSKPMAIGVGIAAVVGLCFVFKVRMFLAKVLLLLAALAAIGFAAWSYYQAHHG